MAAKVIHFGPDECHRLMVLRSAGYSVEDCRSLAELRAILDAGAAADALLMSDAEGVDPQEAIAVARSRESLPVVLFRSTNLTYQESGIDLVVHCLTPPEVWLNQMDSLIERSRILRAQSKALVDQSAQLRRESAAVRGWSRSERRRSRVECARNAGYFRAEPFFPKSEPK
jgi:hypothetical protein